MLNPKAHVAMKSDLNRRHDAFMKQEMAHQKEVISAFHKEMQDIRDSMVMMKNRFDALLSQITDSLVDLKSSANVKNDNMETKIKSSESSNSEMKKCIESFHDMVQDVDRVYVKKSDFEKVMASLHIFLNECDGSESRKFESLQQEVKGFTSEFSNIVSRLEKDTLDCLCSMNQNWEEKLSLAKQDKDTVLKEIRIYEKSMFIIEKKIENLYTLIERLTKRVDECHKPA